MAQSKRTGGPGDEPEVPGAFDDQDPRGESLASDRLADGEPYVVAPDEAEAEELTEENGDALVDDLEQLEAAEQAAADADSTRPVRRRTSASVAPVVKKDRPTAKQAPPKVVAKEKRTSPAQFVAESVGELRKVVWPTGTQLRQYFTVVLVFVLFMIAFVGLLDFAFGWLLLKLLG